MTAKTIDFMVEEPSMEAFLRVVLPRILGRTQFKIRPFQNKDQLLKHLPSRLQGYAQWIPENVTTQPQSIRDPGSGERGCFSLLTPLSSLLGRSAASGLPCAGGFPPQRPPENLPRRQCVVIDAGARQPKGFRQSPARGSDERVANHGKGWPGMARAG